MCGFVIYIEPKIPKIIHKYINLSFACIVKIYSTTVYFLHPIQFCCKNPPCRIPLDLKRIATFLLDLSIVKRSW